MRKVGIGMNSHSRLNEVPSETGIKLFSILFGKFLLGYCAVLKCSGMFHSRIWAFEVVWHSVTVLR